MKANTAEWLTVAAGILLIVVYSVLMTATEGSSGWAWILLVAGIGMLVGGGVMLRRSASSGNGQSS
jgi:zinc transporter ZupT